jgi:Domain of unknown function (DUF6875)
MPTQIANLFLLEDLEDIGKTSELAESDLEALRSIADWIKSYVLKPHMDLIGRDGPVCPFLPASVKRNALWLAPEHVFDGGTPIVERMNGYKRRLLEAEPTGGDGELQRDSGRLHRLAGQSCASRLRRGHPAACSSFVCRGWTPVWAVLRGQRGHGDLQLGLPAIRVARSVLFVRHGVIGDWKFFLENEDWLNLWARRYEEFGAQALAEELRRLPWRAAEC